MSKNMRVGISLILLIPLAYLLYNWINNLINPSNFRLETKIYLGYLITILSVAIAWLLSIGKVKKRKFQIWGIAIMLVISAPLSYSIGFSYAIYEGSGFAALLMLYVFPILFITGLMLLLVGIFKKGKTNSRNVMSVL